MHKAGLSTGVIVRCGIEIANGVKPHVAQVFNIFPGRRLQSEKLNIGRAILIV